MPSVVRQPAPGRLDVQEGGGGLILFGLPFLAAGTYVILGSLGIVAMRADPDASSRPGLLLLGIAFALIGAVIAFGRRVTSLDLAGHVAITQWRLLLPLRSWTYQLGNYTAVTIAFVRGDSDSADQYPVGLKARSGPSLVLCRPTAYAQAREHAVAVARHLGLDIEDSSTGRSARVQASDADTPLQQRLHGAGPVPMRPSVMRSDTSETDGRVRIVIPMPPLNPFVAAASLLPAVIAMAMLGWLGVFSRSRPLAPGEWIFFGMLFVGFTILPVASAANLWLRSRLGRTIVTVSPEGLRIEERGTLSTRTRASFASSEILDVDVSTKASVMASARRDAAQQASTMRDAAAVTEVPSPAAERVFAVVSAFATGKGIIVKSRHGLTAFGEGLADDEICYLHALVERALAGDFPPNRPETAWSAR